MLFAEHELKVTKARIKDKFASMLKLGRWATGAAPVGYKLVDKKMVINEAVAPIIRHMYMRFIETGSATQVAQEMNLKVLDLPKEEAEKIGIFHRKRIYSRLKSPVYKGYLDGKGTLYKGQHEALVSEEIWEQAQKIVDTPIRKTPEKRAPLEFALRSKLRCKECNHAMIISITTKRHKQYAYCTCLNKHNGAVCKGLDMNINVDLVHRIVRKEVRQILQMPEMLGNLWKNLSEKLSAEDAYKRLQNIDKAWDYLTPGDQTHILQEFVKTVWLGNKGIVIEFAPNSFCGDAETCEVLSLPGKFYNRGSKQQVFVHQEEPDERQEPEILKALVQAEVWIDEIRKGRYATYQEMAEMYCLPEEYIRRGLYFAFLAPKVKEAIIDGKLLPTFTLRDFNRRYPATDWTEQEAYFLNV
jgi:site-specific DNA recombinase